MSIEDKILALIKMANPNDPIEYVQEIIKTYAIEKVNNRITKCSECELCNYGVKTISYGNSSSRILMIGESISEEQYNKGDAITLPLLDSSGVTLNNALGVIKANKDAIYIMNSVNCYPAKSNNVEVIKRIPSVKERTACKSHVDTIIDILKPSVIITLGSVAANALSPNKISIMESRGIVFDYKGYPVMPTFHPGFFAQMTDRFDADIMDMYKDNFLTDLYTAFMIAKDNDPNCSIGSIELPF